GRAGGGRGVPGGRPGRPGGARGEPAVGGAARRRRGVVAASMAEQFIPSVGVGLLWFALLALVPGPPLDGYRLLRLAWGGRDPELPPVVDRLGVLALLLLLVVPVHGTAPLPAALAAVGPPLLRPWTCASV